ncbi:MAG: hypothetical protein GF393_10990 [Armatimonadia bacterium]|nr:hypothetical protein [Armatimonadia bacterium]
MLASLLTADRQWDEEMAYFTGQNMKSVAEVLRATGHLWLAVTVAELARNLQESQPALQLTCQELLDLLADEMPEQDCREALSEAEGLKSSDAIAMAREALGV